MKRILFLLLAATMACTALTACDEDEHHVRHTYHGNHHDYDRDDYHHAYRSDAVYRSGYRRDAYYGGSAGGTSVIPPPVTV